MCGKNALLKLVSVRGARKTDCSLGHQHAQNQTTKHPDRVDQSKKDNHKHLQNHALSKLSKKKIAMSQKRTKCVSGSLVWIHVKSESETEEH